MLNHSLRESRTHGSAAYPVSAYVMQMGAGEPVLGCHWHCEYEFLLMTSGSAVFQVGANEYSMSAGDFIFIFSEELHAGHPVADGPCDYSAVVFDASFLLSHENDLLQDRYFTPLFSKRFVLPEYYNGQALWCAEIFALLQETVRLNKDRPAAFELMTKSRLNAVFALLFGHCPNTAGRIDPLAAERAGQLKVILDYIHTHYQERITLRDMAASMNMSEGYFCRFFKKFMRKTPFEYLIGYRVNRAALLLDGSLMKVSRAAEEVGFENFSYFTEVFKKVMKCTPSEYRSRGRSIAPAES